MQGPFAVMGDGCPWRGPWNHKRRTGCSVIGDYMSHLQDVGIGKGPAPMGTSVVKRRRNGMKKYATGVSFGPREAEVARHESACLTQGLPYVFQYVKAHAGELGIMVAADSPAKLGKSDIMSLYRRLREWLREHGDFSGMTADEYMLLYAAQKFLNWLIGRLWAMDSKAAEKVEKEEDGNDGLREALKGLGDDRGSGPSTMPGWLSAGDREAVSALYAFRSRYCGQRA